MGLPGWKDWTTQNRCLQAGGLSPAMAWSLGVMERNMGVQLHRCKGCAYLCLCAPFSAFSGLGDDHVTGNQLVCSNTILFYRHTHQLSRSCCTNSWASPIPSTCKIEHHTLLLTLLYNCSPVRSHPNLYPNYWEYFIATEIMLRLTTIHFSVQTYLLLSNNGEVRWKLWFYNFKIINFKFDSFNNTHLFLLWA